MQMKIFQASIADADMFQLSSNKKMTTYLVVISSVVSNKSNMPDGEDTSSSENNIGIVEFVVVRHPASDESPEGLHIWISSKSSGLLWLATCIIKLIG